MKPLEEREERIFTLSDIRWLYRTKQIQIFQVMFLSWVALFGIGLLKAPKYKIEATFKEGAEKGNSSEGLLKEMLFSMGTSPSQPNAAALMKSHQVLKPLIMRLGLQAAVPRNSWKIAKLYRRVRDNFLAQKGALLEEPDDFVFREVVYEGEEGLAFFLRLDDATHFTILGRDKKPITHGMVGLETCLPEAQFTLQKIPKNVRLHRLYPLHIASWVPLANGLRGDLKISSQKLNQSVYEISCLHRSRTRGVELINALMEEYQRYLKRSHDELSTSQIAYLDKRQEEIACKVNEYFKEYADYLTRNLGEKGFAGLKDGINNFLTPYQRIEESIFAADVELSRLKECNEGDHWLIGKDGQVMEIFREMGKLKQQRDLLELSLHARQEPALYAKQEELKEIREQREASQKLFESAVQGELSFDPECSLTAWAKDLSEAERGDLTAYLENHIRLLSLREKMLQERFFYGEGIQSEFEGVDLPSARKLFVEYNQRLDEGEAAARCYTQLREEIEEPDFEIGSLSVVLNDPLSQKLIAQSGELALRLKDEKHRSEKEGLRWKEELDLQKKLLKEHLAQLLKVEELNTSLVREKIGGLQQLSLDCINREISVLREQLQDVLREKKEALLNEKALLEKKATEMRASMTHLPELWRLEKWLELKTQMGVKFMESISQYVESKVINHHLHHIDSKPLDLAMLPAAPQSPHLFRIAFLGAFALGFGFFFIALLQRIAKGFPSSFEKLRAMRFPLLGKISPFCDGPEVGEITGEDLEALRQMGLFFEKPPLGKVIALLAGQGPDYSYPLAENLARRSIRSLILRCDFGATYQKEDLPGLLQVAREELSEIPIRSQNGFDFVTAGGFTPYGVEMIQSKKFEQLLESLKEKYDYLFLLFRSPLDHAESKAALRLCDKAVVTVSGEPTEILTPFVDWAYHKEDSRLTFIVIK